MKNLEKEFQSLMKDYYRNKKKYPDPDNPYVEYEEDYPW